MSVTDLIYELERPMFVWRMAQAKINRVGIDARLQKGAYTTKRRAESDIHTIVIQYVNEQGGV